MVPFFFNAVGYFRQSVVSHNPVFARGFARRGRAVNILKPVQFQRGIFQRLAYKNKDVGIFPYKFGRRSGRTNKIAGVFGF